MTEQEKVLMLLTEKELQLIRLLRRSAGKELRIFVQSAKLARVEVISTEK